MVQQALTTVEFDLDAGDPSLDFANTLDGRFDSVPDEQLHDYTDLVAFGLQSRTISESEANRLLEEAARRPDAAYASLQQAIAFRETFYRIVSAVIAGNAPEPADLDTFNATLAETLPHLRVVPGDGGFQQGWEPEPVKLDRVLWPVVRSALDLLTSDDFDRVRECAADDCGWLFLDTSRNRSRKWCSMTTCGNRAKVERFRKRDSE